MVDRPVLAGWHGAVTGREYNGLLDTPCFQRGKMSCLSCHSMHGYHDRNDQLAPRMETNQRAPSAMRTSAKT